MAIYRYDEYCKDEIPNLGYCVLVTDEPLQSFPNPGACYTEMGTQMENTMIIPFCADEPFEAIAELWKLFPSYFLNDPRTFYFYKWEEGEITSLGNVDWGYTLISFHLAIPVNRGDEFVVDNDPYEHPDEGELDRITVDYLLRLPGAYFGDFD